MMKSNDSNTPSSQVDADLLRTAMRRFASGVTVVTARNSDGPSGITVSAFSSISLEPPVIMVSINTTSSVAPVILDAEAFAVHILSSDQEELSVRFAESLSWEEKVRSAEWKNGITGSPILTEAYTALEASLLKSLTIGTHTVMFGQVVDLYLHPSTPEAPLLYYDRNYRTLDRILDDPASQA